MPKKKSIYDHRIAYDFTLGILVVGTQLKDVGLKALWVDKNVAAMVLVGAECDSVCKLIISHGVQSGACTD